MKKIKRIFCLALVLCLMAGFVPAPAAAAGSLPFTDVPENAWYRSSVEYVYENNIMSGTAADKFSPSLTTTRGMIVTILHRLAGNPVVEGETFTDVAPGKYYAAPVAWASSQGIVTGYGNGQFGPDKPITREQLATILYRYSAYAGLNTGLSADIGSFADSAAVSTYAREAMSWAVGSGLISGVGDNKLDPGGSATRAQVAAIFTRFMTSETLASTDPGTGYAIVDLEVVGSTVTAAVSTIEACSIKLEVLSEDGEKSLWTGSYKLLGDMELQYSSMATGYSFPESFIITAVLTDDAGNELCNKFVCRRYTAAFRAFSALTEADFAGEGDRLLDLVAADDGNFALLREDVKLLSVSPSYDKNGVYKFRSADLPAGLAAGAKICFPDAEGRWATVLVASLSRNGSETTIVENPDSYLDDFYEKIKLSADLASLSGSSSASSSGGDKDWLSELKMGPAVENSFKTPFGSFGHKTSVGGKLEFNYGIEGWEAYIEYTMLVGIETELNLEIGPHIKLDDTLEIAEIPLTGIPDVADIPAALSLAYEIDCDAGFDTTITLEAATGIVYNSLDGSQKVEQKDIATGEPSLEGEVEAKFGLLAEVKAEVFDGKLSAALGAEAGVIWSAKGEVPLGPLPGSDSYHACLLCADGSTGGYFEAGVSADYKLSKNIEGSIVDLDFLRIEWIISRFYLSLANEAESVHGGKVVFDMGECPNKKYRSDFSTHAYGREKSGITVTVRSGGGLVGSGASPWQLYLYPGSYTALATIEDEDVSETFAIDSKPVAVKLSVAEKTLSGTVTDAKSGKAISGVSVTVMGDASKTLTTDSAGRYSVKLPNGDYTLSFSADNYKSATASVSLSEDTTLNMALEKLIEPSVITGIVTDKETGKPIAGASVTAISTVDSDSASATTDSSGHYRIEVPGDKTYSLTYSAEGYHELSLRQELEAGWEYTFNKALEPLKSEVTITVTSWGSPYAGATVEISGVGKFTTGDDGTVTIDLSSIPEGSYLIIARTREYYGNGTLYVPARGDITVDAFMLIH